MITKATKDTIKDIIEPLVNKYPALQVEPESYSFFVRVHEYEQAKDLQENELIETLNEDINNSNQISIYLHYPFCERELCKFCHYTKLTFNRGNDLIVDLLYKEIKKFEEKIPGIRDKEITSFYIGGGTPSLMNEGNINKIFNAFKDWNFSKDCEKTIEATPYTLTDEKIDFLTQKFNRMSVGVQTLNEEILKKVTRSNRDPEKIEERLSKFFKKCEERNIISNVDLMYGFPEQKSKPELLCEDIKQILKKTDGPSSFTLYRLRLKRIGEDESDLMAEYEKDPDSFPGQFESYRMNESAEELLKESGYKEGPIGWFNKNCSPRVYTDRWSTMIPLIGFGLGAYSYTENVQYRNQKDPDQYRYYVDIREELPLSSAIRFDEQTRLKRKISFLLKQMSEIALDEMKVILDESFIKEGLFEIRDNKVRLTKAGILMVEEIISGLIWRDVKIFFSH